MDLVEKLTDGKYALTVKGKEFSNRFDTDNKVIERQAKLACGILCIKVEDGVTKYLLQKRLKQPYYGYYGVVGGTILGADGRKMSKSIGNVISPFEQADKFGTEAVRYYLLAGISTYNDASYKEDDLIKLYNSNLADNFGNLLNRVIHLMNTNDLEIDSTNISVDFQNKLNEFENKVSGAFEDFELQTACENINEIFSFGNKYINENEPWKKNDRYEEVINNLYYLLVLGAKLYAPIIPNKSQEALKALNQKKEIILFEKF